MFKTILASTVMLTAMPVLSHAVSLEKLIQSAPIVKNWSGFSSGNCFHCTDAESMITIDGQRYEISTFRVNGINDQSGLKTFGDVVAKLDIATAESETKQLYKDFPEVGYELWNIKSDDPKVQIVIALRKA